MLAQYTEIDRQTGGFTPYGTPYGGSLRAYLSSQPSLNFLTFLQLGQCLRSDVYLLQSSDKIGGDWSAPAKSHL